MIAMAGRIIAGAVGLKGLVFVETLLSRGIRLDEIVTYRQEDDRAQGFDRLRELARGASVSLTQSRRPDVQQHDLLFLVGWQFILPPAGGQAVVFHDSMLPRYRGFAPTVTALIRGDDEIGVTALSPSDSVDEGLVFGQRSARIDYPIKIEEALKQQACLMAELAIDIIDRWRAGALSTAAQDPARATYSLWRDEADYEIDWSTSAAQIKRFVDAVGFPYAGARTLVGDATILRVHDVTPLPDLQIELRDVGKVWKLDAGRAVVVCGSGLLRIDRCTTEAGADYRFERLRVRLGGR